LNGATQEPPMSEEHERPPSGLRNLQLIVTALVMGVAIFAVVATVVAPPAGSTPPPTDMLRMVAVVLLVTTLPMSFVMRQVILRGTAGRDPGPEAVFKRFFTATIVACALLEASSLFCLVTYLVSRDAIDLLLGAVPLVVIVAAVSPTVGRWNRVKASL
jgi:hypothetical protein